MSALSDARDKALAESKHIVDALRHAKEREARQAMEDILERQRQVKVLKPAKRQHES
ncbi:MAG: hypothetical protein ACRCU5_13915 [Rhizobiaceae bacterium]